MDKKKRERENIDRINAKIQEKKQVSHFDVYDQVNQDIQEVCYRFKTDLNELLSGTRTKMVAEAKATICTVALERLRPLGISDCDIAKFLGIQRTTMLFAVKRWKRHNAEKPWESHQETKEKETND